MRNNNNNLFLLSRNPTGYLIVSLALADLIVGLVVMPLNSLFEMTRHVWLLGKFAWSLQMFKLFFVGMTACDIFHAMDILASTSSIWNLCVISLDRYMAGQDPIGYRDRVSKKRITIAIVFVWVMSACKFSVCWKFSWKTRHPFLHFSDSFACHSSWLNSTCVRQFAFLDFFEPKSH